MNPVESTLEITTVAGCRVGCQVCPQGTFLRAYRGERALALDRFKQCVDKVPDWVQIDFSGFAEPWLNYQCSDMLEYAARGHRVYVYTTLVGMSENDARRLDAVAPKHLGIHIRDKDDRSPIHEANLYLIKLLHPSEFISHGPPHPAVVPYLTPGVPVANCRLNSRAGKVWAGEYRTGPLRCSSTRRHRHNVMLPDGTVVLCCMDYGMQHILGNLVTDSYESLFAPGSEYARIEQLALTEEGDFLCRRCELSEVLR
jgi:hypothetical protein